MKEPVSLREFSSKHHPKLKWVVYWPSGEPRRPRKSRRFATKSEAQAFQDHKKIQVTNEGRKAAAMRDSVFDDAVWASEKLSTYGVTLRSVVDDFIARNESALNSARIDEGLYDFLEMKERAGKSGRYMSDLRARGKRFAGDFPDRVFAEISVTDANEWLARLNVASVTRNNYRRTLAVLFAWANKSGFCSINPFQAAERASEASGRVPIFTPAELRIVFDSAPRELIPFLAIGAFAGLRSEEIRKLQWEDIDFKKRRIDVNADVSKTATNRYVPLRSPLFEWLHPVAKSSGSVVPLNLLDRLKRFRKALASKDAAIPVEWKHNGLRHSFASYALAESDNAPQVALWLGHASPRVIFEHYRERVEPDDASAWFSCGPDVSEIIEFNAA